MSESSPPKSDLVLQAVLTLGQRLTAVEQKMEAVHSLLTSQKVEKEWYSTSDLAEALGKSQYTVQER